MLHSVLSKPIPFLNLSCGKKKTVWSQFPGKLISATQKRHHLRNPWSVPRLTTYGISVNFQSNHIEKCSPGSWNMTTTSSADTWTSVDCGYEIETSETWGGELPLSMPSAPSRIAASKLASVFSGKRDDAWDKLSMLPSSGSHMIESKENNVCIVVASGR